jgi:hypothetical protein
MYPIYSPYVHTDTPMRLFAWGYTYIRVRLHVYTYKPMPIYVWGFAYIRARRCLYTCEALRIYVQCLATPWMRQSFILKKSIRRFVRRFVRQSKLECTAKLCIGVEKIIWTCTLLPLWALKGNLYKWFSVVYASGGYSFYFHYASTQTGW